MLLLMLPFRGDNNNNNEDDDVVVVVASSAAEAYKYIHFRRFMFEAL